MSISRCIIDPSPAKISLTVVVKGPPPDDAPKELVVCNVHQDKSLREAIQGPLMEHYRLSLDKVNPHDGSGTPPWERPCIEFEVSGVPKVYRK